MRKLTLAVVLLLSQLTYAVDGKSLLIGIGIGLGLYYKPVANHTVKPMARKIQRTVRPLPQDKVEAQQKKEAKRLKKEKKNAKAAGDGAAAPKDQQGASK